jgi:serine/threonine protein kinase
LKFTEYSRGKFLDLMHSVETVTTAEQGSTLLNSRTPRVPDHQLLFAIARGAYGQVWLALNAVGSPRAVKIVRREQHASHESFEREFKGLQKFEPISRSHVGLVDVLTLGLLPDKAGFYYVMELADDIQVCRNSSHSEQSRTLKAGGQTTYPGQYEARTLRADLKSHSFLPAGDVITLGVKLAAALEHLHGHGLVHRDVKPSNILFIDGEPKLADAGLVADMADARSLVGTAGYIAPEGPGRPQADLYALGKVLYEAAFGKDRQEFPSLPASVASRPDHTQLLELNAILLKACAPDPKDRYSSVKEMRSDLEALLAGRSIQRLHAWQRTLKHAKRFGLAASALTIVALIGLYFQPRGTRAPDFKWSPNPEARDEFRKGMRFMHSAGSSFEAIPHFQKATDLDPKFADAYAYLARAWIASSGATNQHGHAREAAERALSFNSNSALAWSVLGSVKMNELDWAGADAARMRARSLAPNSEDVLLTSALNLVCMGKPKEALADLRKAQQVDPGSASSLRTIYSGFVYLWSGQYDDALDVFSQFPDGSYWMKEQHALAYLAKDDYPNAIRLEREAALARSGDTNAVTKEFDALAQAFKEGGNHEYWKRKLEFETPKTGDEHWMRLAAIYARLNQPVEAFKYLRQARQETPEDFAAGLNTNPDFRALRQDQRFQDLLAGLWRKK